MYIAANGTGIELTRVSTPNKWGSIGNNAGKHRRDAGEQDAFNHSHQIYGCGAARHVRVQRHHASIFQLLDRPTTNDRKHDRIYNIACVFLLGACHFQFWDPGTKYSEHHAVHNRKHRPLRHTLSALRNSRNPLLRSQRDSSGSGKPDLSASQPRLEYVLDVSATNHIGATKVKRDLAAAGSYKLKSIAVLIIAICGIFLAINVLHFRYLPVHVVLYDSLLDAAVAAATVAVIFYFVFAERSGLTRYEAGLAIVTACLLCALYAVMVPTVIDRSLSIYILEKLNQRGGSIAQSAWPQIFKDEYLPEYKLVDIRLTEQLNSGTITIKDDCVSLTQRGHLIVLLSELYRNNVLPKHREIMGTYTDELTDPFRNSKVVVPFKCPEVSSTP